MFEEAEAAARWGLWGESGTARELRYNVARLVARLAEATREPLNILNVALSGPSGYGKFKVAKAIHGLAGRGSFAMLGPEDGEPDAALFAAMPGGTLYLRECEILRDTVQATVYRALTSRAWQGIPLDTLLIVDSPRTRVVGYGLGEQVNGGRGFPATLGRNVPGSWSFIDVPALRKRISDVPVLVNKMLEVLHADGLADIRQHLAVWFQGEIAQSRAMLEEGWLVRAVLQVCEAACPEWSRPAYLSSASPRQRASESQGSTQEGGHAIGVASWEEVTITFTSRDAAKVSATEGVIRTGHYDALGFADKRTQEKPVLSWFLLQVLVATGEISMDAAAASPWRGNTTDLRKVVQDLRKRLKCLADLEDDPLHPYSRREKRWRPRFIGRDRSHGGQGGGLLVDPSVGFDDEAADEDEMAPEIREIYDEQTKRRSGKNPLGEIS